MSDNVTIGRRFGSTPQERGSLNNGTCPDVFECFCDDTLLDPGREGVAMIGTDRTDELRDKVAAWGGQLQAGDRIIVLDRRTMMDAVREMAVQDEQ